MEASSPAPTSAFAARQPLPTTLAFVAGYVDACTFLAFAGFFVAQATGSFVVAGSELVTDNDDVALKVLAIPVFLLAGVVATFVVRSLDQRARQALATALVAEACLLIGLVLAGRAGLSETAALFGLAAMGVQSAASRLLLPAYGSSNVMTTNTTQLSIDLADSILNRRLVPRFRQTGLIMLGFFAGVVVGGAAFTMMGFACVVFAVAIVLAIAGLVALTDVLVDGG